MDDELRMYMASALAGDEVPGFQKIVLAERNSNDANVGYPRRNVNHPHIKIDAKAASLDTNYMG